MKKCSLSEELGPLHILNFDVDILLQRFKLHEVKGFFAIFLASRRSARKL